MKATRLVLLVVGVGVCLGALSGCGGFRFVIDAVPADDRMKETEVLRDPGASSRAAKIALIEVSGFIADSKQDSFLRDGENPVARLAESLRRAGDDPDVKAIVMRINSPGGTVTGSDTMYREVQHMKERTGKPVVVLMGDVAASGGYYLACAGDEIIAMPTSITGSIGVIIQTVNVSDGLQRIGVRADAITSGDNKAMGSPLEPMPVEHRDLLQGIVDDFYDGFRRVVVGNRPTLSPGDLDWVTDGRIITGRRAAEIGIVDSVGDIRDAFAAAKTRAGVNAARLVKYHRPLEFVGSPYATTPTISTEVNLLKLQFDGGGLFDHSGFLYLWDPSVW